MKREENESRVGEMQEFNMNDNSTKITPDSSATHEREIYLGGARPTTTKQHHAQAVGVELQKYVLQEIVDYCDEESETLYRVRWFGYSAEDDTWEPGDNNLQHVDSLY